MSQFFEIKKEYHKNDLHRFFLSYKSFLCALHLKVLTVHLLEPFVKLSALRFKTKQCSASFVHFLHTMLT